MGRTILRYVVALLVITYGFGKLNGSQFTVLDSELDKPMGQVSGFWLTWYYFGYSKVYGNLIALAQVVGGVLLMFGRTTLLGSCLLLPIITNIILVDVFYGVELSALLTALFIEAALLIIIGRTRRRLRAARVRRRSAIGEIVEGIATVVKFSAVVVLRGFCVPAV